MMRKILAVLLLLTGLAGATTVTVTGTVTGPDGNPLPSGQIIFTLPFSARDTSTNRFVTSLPQIPFTVANGQIQAGATLIPNDVLSPSGYYILQVFTADGSMYGMSNVVIPTGGGTYDIGQATPTSVLTSNISYITPASLSGNNTWTGINTFTQQMISTVVTGTAPFSVLSTTKVASLWVAGLISDTPNAATAGTIRLANADKICFRDIGNTWNDCIRQDPANNYRFQVAPDDGSNRIFNLSVTHNVSWANSLYGTATNTTNAENGLLSLVIPANGFAVGQVSAGVSGAVGYHLRWTGLATNTSGGASNYTLRARLDSASGTLLCSSAVVSIATGVSNAPLRLDCYVNNLTLGAVGTVEGTCNYNINATTGDCTNAAAIVVDTTVSHTILPTVQMSVSNANTSWKWGTMSVVREGQ